MSGYGVYRELAIGIEQEMHILERHRRVVTDITMSCDLHHCDFPAIESDDLWGSLNGVSASQRAIKRRSLMDSKPFSVLVVGDITINSPSLLPWLRRRGCHCELAGSCEEACRLIAGKEFDLVLSQYQLRDRTALPLLDGLTGSNATLFFSTAARNDSRWLAMIERGARRVGAPVMRTPELTAAIEKLLDIKPATVNVKESLFDVMA